jgi:DNA-binding transcriptional LysR family regulator
MHDIDTALLRTFAVLAETLSFSRTGERIGRSQSAVSGQIRRLEDLLGRRLLARDTRNVALTADGERLLAHARQVIAAADALLERFRTPEIAGTVRFGSPEDFATAWLPDILAAFARAHPAVRLTASCALTLPLMEDFAAGRLDLVVVKQDPGRRHPGARPLWREELVWVAAPGRAAAPADAGAPLPLVLAPAPCVYRLRATRALDAARLAWREAFVSPSFAGQAAAVRAGLGYAVMPRGKVPDGLAVLDGWPAPEAAEIALLAPARPAPAVAALAAFVAGHVARRRA